MSTRTTRSGDSPSTLRRSREILKTTHNSNGGDSLILSHIEEMIKITDSLPRPAPQFTVDPDLLERIRRNAAAGQNHRNTTPKRPRSDSDPSQSESAKRLRSSLRSSSKNLPPPDLSQTEESAPRHNTTNQTHEPQPRHVTAKTQPPHVQTRSRSTSISVEPPEDDINALLTFARDIKHRGDEDRKASHDTVKRNPRADSPQYDRFLENYLRASLTYIRCCSIYEKRRLIDQARDVYASTAKLAIYAATNISDQSPIYRRALASLCLKSAAIAYARRYQMSRKKSATVNAELEETIRSNSSDVGRSLDLVKALRIIADECDSDARGTTQRWQESIKLAPDGMNDFEMEVPLNPDTIAFVNYAKAEQQRSRYLEHED